MKVRDISHYIKWYSGVAILSLCLLGVGCTPPNAKLDLSGQGLAQVPQDVFKQTYLVELDLSNNNLTGSIPAEIRFLSKLEILDLSDNAMTGLPAEVGQLRNLKTLDLSHNQLTGLPLELGQLTVLETLDLRGNAVSSYDLDLIRKNLTYTKILVD